MIECDVRVPEALRAHFAEMQPVFKNIGMQREDLGSVHAPIRRRARHNEDSASHARG